MDKEKVTKKVATAEKKVIKKDDSKKSETEKVVKKTDSGSKKPSFNLDDKYFYAVGRRKTSTAQVRLYPIKKAGDNDLIINNRKMKDYFLGLSLQTNFLSPLREIGMQDDFGISVLVKGGGVSSQVEAARLGVARALIKFDESLRTVLKANGFLTRDARKVERKKPGLKKARRAPQWSKR